jgi:hypothetical protein
MNTENQENKGLRYQISVEKVNIFRSEVRDATTRESGFNSSMAGFIRKLLTARRAGFGFIRRA